jgi:hypothetical protein
MLLGIQSLGFVSLQNFFESLAAEMTSSGHSNRGLLPISHFDQYFSRKQGGDRVNSTLLMLLHPLQQSLVLRRIQDSAVSFSSLARMIFWDFIPDR